MSATCPRPPSPPRSSRRTASPRCAPTPIPPQTSNDRRVFALSLGALVRVERFEGDFAVTPDGLHVYASHLAPIDSFEPDFVAVAERFAETPYLWGGRTSEGIDCSGLVQSALGAAGICAPRDSDMMEAALGAPLPVDDALDICGAAI